MAGISTRADRLAARTRSVAALAVILLGATSAARPPPRKAASLCRAGETPLFSCSVGIKVVSVCGGAAGATYRYGRPGRVELTARNVTVARRGYSGGGEMQITAANGRHRYVTYTRTVRTAFGADGRHDPQFSSGLIVKLGSRTLLSKSCAGDPVMAGDPERLLPKGAFIED